MKMLIVLFYVIASLGLTLAFPAQCLAVGLAYLVLRKLSLV